VKHKALILATFFAMILSPAIAGVESIDRMQYDSNGEFFDGELINIQYLADRDTDQIDVFLDSGTLSDRTGQNVESDVTIDVESQENSVYYSIGSSTRSYLPNLDPYLSSWYNSEEEALNAVKDTCYSNPHGPDYLTDKRFVPIIGIGEQTRIFCFSQTGIEGTPGDISQDRIGFTTQWLIDSSTAGSESFTISSSDIGRGETTRASSNVAIEWDGSLSTGNLVPNVDDELALHSNRYDGGWRVVSQERYDDFENYMSDAGSHFQDWRSGVLTQDQLDSNVDEQVTEASQPFSESPLNTTSVTDTSVDGGELKYTPGEDFLFPSFSIFVDAGENGFVQVTRPVGLPNIIDSSGDSFAEADEGRISMTVENVGDGEGTFIPSATCDSPFSAGGASRMNIGAGEVHTFRFDVSGSSTDFSQSEISGSCSMSVTEQGSQSSDSTSVGVTLTQERQCSGPQTVIVEDGQEVIYECVDGQPRDVVDTCGQGEVAEEAGGGTFECVDETGPDGDGGFLSGLLPDFEFGTGTDLGDGISILEALDLFASAVIGVVSFGVGSQVFSRFVSPTVAAASNLEEPIINLVGAVVSAVAGFALGFLLISDLRVKALILVAGIAYTAIQGYLGPVFDAVGGGA